MAIFASMQLTVRELCHAIARLDPPIEPRLRAPASEEEIRSAEKKLGLVFPVDLKHFLLCHNGQEFYHAQRGYGDPIVPMLRHTASGQGYSHYWLGGTLEIVEYTQTYREEWQWFQAEQFEALGPARHHDHLIVITGTENADCLVLDLQPEPGGTMGQVVLLCTQPPHIVVVAPDLVTFLQTLAADYRQGRFRPRPCEHFVSYAEAD
jgi:cell wall assembly regulator SMI1